MPVKEFLRRLSNTGRSKSSSSAQSPENLAVAAQLPSLPSESISVSNAHKRASSAVGDQNPQISSRKFEQHYRTRWPSCGASNSPFGPEGSTAILEVLGIGGLDGMDEKELAEVTKTLAVAGGVGTDEHVNKQVRGKNGSGLEKEKTQGFRGGNQRQMTNRYLDDEGDPVANRVNQEPLNDMDFLREKDNNDDSNDEDTFLDGIEEISAICDQITKLQGFRVDQEEIQVEGIDPIARNISLENESRGMLKTGKWKHHCVIEGHLFVKKSRQKTEGKTKNMVEDKSVRCEVCCHYLKNAETFVCDIRVCGITTCFSCAERLDNEKKEKARESWRLS